MLCTRTIKNGSLIFFVIHFYRYIGVSRPLSYVRLVTKKKTRLLILGIWLVSFLIAVGPPLGWKDHKSDGQ